MEAVFRGNGVRFIAEHLDGDDFRFFFRIQGHGHAGEGIEAFARDLRTVIVGGGELRRDSKGLGGVGDLYVVVCGIGIEGNGRACGIGERQVAAVGCEGERAALEMSLPDDPEDIVLIVGYAAVGFRGAQRDGGGHAAGRDEVDETCGRRCADCSGDRRFFCAAHFFADGIEVIVQRRYGIAVLCRSLRIHAADGVGDHIAEAVRIGRKGALRLERFARRGRGIVVEYRTLYGVRRDRFRGFQSQPIGSGKREGCVIPYIFRCDAGVRAAGDQPVGAVRGGHDGIPRRVADLRSASVRRIHRDGGRIAVGDVQGISGGLPLGRHGNDRIGVRRRIDRSGARDRIAFTVAFCAEEDTVGDGRHGIFVRVGIEYGREDLCRAVRRFYGDGRERRHAHKVHRVGLHLRIAVILRIPCLEQHGAAFHAVGEAVGHARGVGVPRAGDRGGVAAVGLFVHGADLRFGCIRHCADLGVQVEERRAVVNIKGTLVGIGDLGGIDIGIVISEGGSTEADGAEPFAIRELCGKRGVGGDGK